MSLTPLTPAGHKKLQDELQDLKSVQRPQVIDAIAKARAHGDLKENGEYHAAREQQAFIEGRIRELESKISSSQIIDITTLPNKGKVIFGCTVSLVDEEDNKITYQIVGEDEADLKEGKISVLSPLARGMIGKEIGEEAVITTPKGEIIYEILDVQHA